MAGTPADPRWIGSPNYRRGRGGDRPRAVVIHLMAGSLAGTDAWFRNRKSRVSAHYGIGRGGAVHQYVRERDTAWHAGRVHKPTWAGLRRGSPNRYTVGIEHEGHLADDWPEPMLRASAALIAAVCGRWGIPIDRDHVVGHREIYARKACPGDRVDLDRLVALARDAAGQSPLVARTDPAFGGPYNFVADAGEVTTSTSLNVRAAPTARSARLRAAAPGTALRTAGWTSNGQSVRGNAHWYRLADGTHVWAGGTAAPVPALGEADG